MRDFISGEADPCKAADFEEILNEQYDNMTDQCCIIIITRINMVNVLHQHHVE